MHLSALLRARSCTLTSSFCEVRKSLPELVLTIAGLALDGLAPNLFPPLRAQRLCGNARTLQPEVVQADYLKALQEFLDHYSNEMGKRNIWYSLVDTSAPLDEPLFSFFMRNMVV